MKKKFKGQWLYAFALLGSLSLIFSSCSDDDNEITFNTAKIEVKGNFSGTLLIAYTFSSTNGGESNTVETKTLPWSKEYNFQRQIAMGGGVRSIVKGKPGETVELNLIVGNQIKESAKATANADGEIDTPTISYAQN